MADKIKEIKAIEDSYGLMLFRMALTHLVDVGIRNFDEKYVAESIKQIEAKGEEDKANGVMPIMTSEFQCEIIRCAAELSKFSPWELFAYIKKHVVVS